MVRAGAAVAGRELYHRLVPFVQAIDGDFTVSATMAKLVLLGRPVGPPGMARLGCPADRVRMPEPVLSDVGASSANAACASPRSPAAFSSRP